MNMRHFAAVTAIVVVPALGASAALGSISIATVPVGNPGNGADSTGYGSVAYAYNIGATEVTNAQYAAFLNAVGATDTNDLYNIAMGNPSGGISRVGAPGSYTYATINGRADHPVSNVSFWDACRFANWLHNGQPTGPQDNTTTEDGAYTLTPAGMSQNTVTRNVGWEWAVTSEDEWYKAAYHHPAAQGGDSDDYWGFPTSSNSITTGDANYNGLLGDTEPAGSYAPNHYGVFDLGGNVFEWNETIITTPSGATRRGIRGGGFNSPADDLEFSARGSLGPTSDSISWGFRVVQIPAPSSGALLGLGGVLAPMGFRARRRLS